MKLTRVTSCFALLLTATAVTSLQAGRSDGTASDSASPATPWPGRYGTVPLGFEPNRGQASSDVRFVARGEGYAILLTNDGVRLALRRSRTTRRAAIHLRFDGANVPEAIEPLDRMPGVAHYFIGSDPAAWRTDVPLFARVRYRRVLAGVDLVFYGNARQLEYDVIVAPGADPRRITMACDGVDRLTIDAGGDLVLDVAGESVRLQKPVLYQTRDDGTRAAVAGAYRLDAERHVGFVVGEYDPSRTLVIDPVLAYATYLGGTNSDNASAIAVDALGHAYLAGATESVDDFPSLPPANGLLGPYGHRLNAFVTKLNPSGTGIVYSVYLGGDRDDAATDIAVDASGNAYVTGYSKSLAFAGDQWGSPAELPFPTTPDAFDRLGKEAPVTEIIPAPDQNAFVAKLDPAGTLLYSTYLGGAGDDVGEGIAADNAGVAYVTGTTKRALVFHTYDFPTTTDAFQRTSNAGGNIGWDSFVTKLNTNAAGAAGLVYSTYLGTPDFDEEAWAIDVDASGAFYVAGRTDSTTFPTTEGAFQRVNLGSGTSLFNWDVFVTKFSPGGTIAYSTYIGGGAGDGATDIVVDSAGSAYITGGTYSGHPIFSDTHPPFPTTAGAFQPQHATDLCSRFWYPGATKRECQDAFVTKLSPDGSAVLLSTYLGGDGDDYAGGISIDSSGRVFIAGEAISANFPLVDAVPNQMLPGFVAALNPTLSDLVYSTWIPASLRDVGIDAAGNAYAVGNNYENKLQTTPGAFQPTLAGSGDVVVVKLTASGPPPPTDTDADGLPDDFEVRFGLDPGSAAGPNGATGDPDNDSKSNAEEYAARTHPRGFYTRYFAEGATSGFFGTYMALLNVGTAQAAVLIHFQKSDGTTVADVALPALRRGHVDVKSILGPGTSEFSTVIESDQPFVADRTMTWDQSGYGSHAETSVTAPATIWYLAEGATIGGFQLFYLIQNPSATQTAQVRVSYLLPSGEPLQKTYPVAPQSRFNIWVNDEARTDPALSVLAAAEVSAVFEVLNDAPVIVERAMYMNTAGQTFGAGHESAGITTPATEWFLAEGATGSFFDLFALVANPNDTPAHITITYLFTDGTTCGREADVSARSRYNIWVDAEQPLLPGCPKDIANAELSTTITADRPVIVERAMWWPGPTAATWTEAHNSAGLPSTGRRWALAEGENDPTRGTETYILIANRGAADTARVTLYYEDRGPESVEIPLAANSRTNVPVLNFFANSAGRRFSAIVEALGPSPQIAVERAMYSDANGVHWAAGTNAVATKLQ